MGQAYFITGTGTEIGKTVATSVLYLSLKAIGKNVTIFKPLQTGLLHDTNTYPDISWYEQELGVEAPGFYTLEPETSPHLAIKLTGEEINEQKVINRIRELQQEYEVVLVEGAGGLAVPLIERADGFYMTKDLVIDSDIPVILVSTSGLGSIHNVVTTYSYAKSLDIRVKTILYNFFQQDQEIHRDNILTVEKLTGLVPLACLPGFTNVRKDLRPYADDLLKDATFTSKLKEVFKSEINM